MAALGLGRVKTVVASATVQVDGKIGVLPSIFLRT